MCILCHGHQTFLKILNFDHSVVNQEKESSRERAFIKGKDNETIQVEGKTIGHKDEEANDSDMSKYSHDQIKRGRDLPGSSPVNSLICLSARLSWQDTPEG